MPEGEKVNGAFSIVFLHRRIAFESQTCHLALLPGRLFSCCWLSYRRATFLWLLFEEEDTGFPLPPTPLFAFIVDSEPDECTSRPGLYSGASSVVFTSALALFSSAGIRLSLSPSLRPLACSCLGMGALFSGFLSAVDVCLCACMFTQCSHVLFCIFSRLFPPSPPPSPLLPSSLSCRFFSFLKFPPPLFLLLFS